MSTFNGFIRKLNAFTGRMLEKALGLKVSITPIKPFDEADITQIKPFSATWNKPCPFCGSDDVGIAFRMPEFGEEVSKSWNWSLSYTLR